MPIVSRAISFAAERHVGQLRKNGKTPYFAHPVRVMTIVLREFGENDPETLATAVLHDTIEDTTTDFDDIAREFGRPVAEAVGFLTKDKRLPEVEREESYFEGLARSSRAVRLVKIADTLDNLRDARSGHGNTAKTVEKAERLFAIFGGDASVRHALEILRGEATRR